MKIVMEEINCKECQTIYSRKVFKTIKENLCPKCKRKNYKKNNLEKVKAHITKSNKKYYLKNREKLLKYQDDYKQQNREKVLNYHRERQKNTKQGYNFYRNFSTNELIIQSLFSLFKMSLKLHKEIPEHLTKDELKEVLEKQDFKCYFTKKSFINPENSLLYPSVSKIDRSKGYTKDNCRIILRGLNFAKHTATEKEILEFLNNVKTNFSKDFQLNKTRLSRIAHKNNIKTKILINQLFEQNNLEHYTMSGFNELNQMLRPTVIKKEENYFITFSSFARVKQFCTEEEFLTFLKIIVEY
jgi:hypothetical protein